MTNKKNTNKSLGSKLLLGIVCTLMTVITTISGFCLVLASISDFYAKSEETLVNDYVNSQINMTMDDIVRSELLGIRLSNYSRLNLAYDIYDSKEKSNFLEEETEEKIAEKGIVEDDLVVYVSLGNPKLDNPSSYTLESLREWKNTQNEKGADLHTGDVTYVNSDTVPVGHVISVESTNVGARMNPVISLGKNLYVVDKDVSWAEAIGKTEEQIRKLCNDNGLNYTVQYEKEGDGTKINTVLKIERIAID